MSAEIIALDGVEPPYDPPYVDRITMHRVEHNPDGTAILTIWCGVAPWKFHLTPHQLEHLKQDLKSN